MEKKIDRCSDVTFDMADEHYGQSTADAKVGDLVWDPKMGDGHVLARYEDATYGWITVQEPRCECDKADLTDHHVTMLSRHG